MSAEITAATQGYSALQLRLKAEVIVSPRRSGGKDYYHFELPSKGTYFRVGFPEYVFISLLDGTRTFSEALALSARKLKSRALPQSHAEDVYRWLLEQELAEVVSQDGRSLDLSDRPLEALRKWNPLWIKLPLGSPNGALRSIAWVGKALFSKAGLWFGWALIALAMMIVWSHRTEFAEDLHGIIAPNNWFRLFVGWVLLKVLHEVGHGLAAQRYGASSRDCGIVVMFFAPMAYIDVTSAWRLPSRWQRMTVALGGIYFELLVAALAAWMWRFTSSEVVSQWLCNVVVTASVTTVLFNANPLMRFDGYFMLSDWIGEANLYSRSREQALGRLSSLFFGEGPVRNESVGIRGRMITVYGFASMTWRILMTFGLILAASAMFQGIGFFFALMVAITSVLQPLVSFGAKIRQRWLEKPSSLVRLTLVCCVCSLLFVAVVGLIPWPGRIVAPAIVDFADECIVRNRVGGFIKRIHVQDGQMVRAGELLIELENRELDLKIAEAEERANKEALAHRLALEEHRVSDAQVALRHHQAAIRRVEELTADRDGLLIHSQVAGKVIARRLMDRLGAYVAPGDSLLMVEDPGKKELRVFVGLEEADHMDSCLGSVVRFHASPEYRCDGVVSRVSPRAVNQLTHASLGAQAGGPLAIRVDSERDEGILQLATPCIEVVVSIDAATCPGIRPGHRGVVVFGWAGKTTLERYWNPLLAWIQKRAKSAQSG